MLTRRTLLGTAAASAVLLAFARPGWTQDAATSFIVNLGNQLVAIVNGPGAAADKKQRLAPLIEQAVDIDEVARFCLGRFWRIATPEQQTRFVRLFHASIITEIANKVGDFQGVTFTPTSTTQQNGESYVGTTIRRPNQQPNNVQWVVNGTSGRQRLVDVVAEGVSLRVTKRNDYAGYLSRNNNNLDALLSAMQRQAGA